MRVLLVLAVLIGGFLFQAHSTDLAMAGQDRAAELACVLSCVDECVRTCEDCDHECDGACNNKCGLEACDE